MCAREKSQARCVSLHRLLNIEILKKKIKKRTLIVVASLIIIIIIIIIIIPVLWGIQASLPLAVSSTFICHFYVCYVL